MVGMIHGGCVPQDKHHCPMPDAEASHAAHSTRVMLGTTLQLSTLLCCVMEHLITQSCQSDHKGGINSRLNGDKVLVGVRGHHVPEQTLQAQQQMAQVSRIVFCLQINRQLLKYQASLAAARLSFRDSHSSKHACKLCHGQ